MVALPERPSDSIPHRVVAIGASAGGLESLEQLFEQLPSDTGMAFVVIQHLSPDFRSVMDDLIARRCEMPVRLVEDGEPVEPNRVYLMPPKKEMIIRDRRLILTDKDPNQGLTLPIDQFFRSLAQDVGPQAVAVVLSGSGSDGSRGVVDVKRAGGLVLVESPASAKFDGMPLSAQATGVVEHAAVPRDIARLLCGLPPLESLEADVLSDDGPLDSVLHQLRDQIVESSDDAIIGKTLDGVITTWNRGAQQLYGYTAEETIGRSVRMLMTPEGMQEFESFLTAIRRGERIEHVHTTRLRKDRSRIEVSITVSPIRDRDGAIVGVSGISRDITPLITAHRELEERQQQIRLLLDSTAEAIFGLDRDGRCTFCNPACVRLLGYQTAEQLIGKVIHPLIHHTSADGTTHDDEACHIHNAFRDGKGVHRDDEVLWRADGSSFPAEYWSYPVRRNGVLVGAVVTFLDVTERRRAEDEIRTAARRREQFLAMLSHELRNPLAAVLNAVKMMQQETLDPEVHTRCQAVVERQARHMARLLDDLLDVSRVSRGKFDLRKEDLDLRRPIEAAIESAQPRLQERAIDLSLELPREAVTVRGDPTRLQQVVVNLLHNAATYSPRGGKVLLGLSAEPAHAVVRVTDHGLGIEPHMIGRIFELFVQAEQPLDRALGGLGVGLSLARNIVELHGGTLDAYSEGADRGSEFTLRLPLQPHALRERRDEAVLLRGERCRIVLIEDQAHSREMLRMLLETLDHVVLEAADGASGVALIAAEHPDVALIDIGLPEMNGYEVAQEVRRRPVLDDVLLVALTGYGAPSDVAEARLAGFDDHLIKPVELRKIEQILARRRPVSR